jgi:hypothetical protein
LCGRMRARNHWFAPSGRHNSSAASTACPSRKMSAQTSTGSPTTRLIGNRPASTVGYTSSITIPWLFRLPMVDKITLAVTIRPCLCGCHDKTVLVPSTCGHDAHKSNLVSGLWFHPSRPRKASRKNHFSWNHLRRALGLVSQTAQRHRCCVMTELAELASQWGVDLAPDSEAVRQISTAFSACSDQQPNRQQTNARIRAYQGADDLRGWLLAVQLYAVRSAGNGGTEISEISRTCYRSHRKSEPPAIFAPFRN